MSPAGEAPHDGATCAVVGCTERGRPQVCPYDQKYHHHGRIHYECHARGAPASSLAFRADGWLLLCDPHYAQVLADLAAQSAQVQS